MTAVKANGNEDILPTEYSLISISNDSLISETVKLAEDGDDVIVRLYESKNTRGSAEITFSFNVSRVMLCDLLENDIKELTVNNNTVKVDFKGFEIITLKISR